MIVDVHSHFFPDRFLAALARDGAAHGAHVEDTPSGRVVWSSPRQASSIGPVFYDVAARLEAVERWGIGLQALSLSPPMLYWAPAALGRDLAAVFNDELAAIAAAHADRFVALATLPLAGYRRRGGRNRARRPARVPGHLHRDERERTLPGRSGV